VSDATDATTTAPTVAALLARAEEAAIKKEWSHAADLLETAGDATAVLDKRLFYLSRAKRYEEALEIAATLRTREPDNFLWPYMTAYQHYVQERYEEAIPWFREALRRNPQHLKSWWRVANALSKCGREAEAVRCGGRVLRLWHDLPPETQERERSNLAKASYFLGKVQMRNDAEGAIPMLEQAVEHDPDDPYKHYRLGKAIRYAGRGAEGVAHLRRAHALKPGDGNIELELALCLGRGGERGEALDILRRRIDRLRGWDLLKAGQLALDLEEPALALTLLERAAGDRLTRSDDRVATALAAARVTAPPRPEPAVGDERQVGRVDVVRPERNFGFLVGDDGVRRHFRLRGPPRLRVGDRVSFVPFEGEKGPAARELEQR
jgi:tetratricopeptide (TPR) repeat protein/cold shock CspA family protein